MKTFITMFLILFCANMKAISSTQETVATPVAIAHYKTMDERVSPVLLLAMCHTETGLKTVHNMNDAGSPSYGICQVKTNAAHEVYKEHSPKKDKKFLSSALKDDFYNMATASRYLGKHLDACAKRYPSVQDHTACALHRYNSGKLVRVPHTAYVNKTMKKYRVCSKVSEKDMMECFTEVSK